MGKNFHRAFEDMDSLTNARTSAFKKGVPTGFKGLDEIASFVPNYTTIIYAPPHVGKSVLTLDILVGIAERTGSKICIYSPEFRKKEELFTSLIQTRLSTAMYGANAASIKDEEFLEAANFVNDHFVVLTKPKREKNDTQERMTLKKIYASVAEAQKAYGWKFDFLFIDPANFIEKTSLEASLQIADYILEINDMMAEFSEALNLHTIVTAHTKDIEMIRDSDTGVLYYSIPHPSQIMSGQSWFRSGYQIIAYWRCPEGVIERETCEPYPANATDVIVQKSKPYGVGRLGKVRLFFDPEKHRMYEYVDGAKYYVNQYYAAEENAKKGVTTKSALQPSRAFNDSEDITNWM